MAEDAELFKVHAAAVNMTDRMFEALMESGEHFSCGEYESILDVFRALGYTETVDILLGPEAHHVIHDDEGDDHFHPDEFFQRSDA
jgi:hypothetical protein